MASNEKLDEIPSIKGLRNIIRMIQCRQCSSLLQSPVRLPCQETVCQACLPPSHKRKYITYPIDKEREQGFYCALKKVDDQVSSPVECGIEHSLADCGLVVALDKVTELFAERMNAVFLSDKILSSDTPFTVDVDNSMNMVLRLNDRSLPLTAAYGSTFVTLYRLAGNGQLPFDTEVDCDPEMASLITLRELDSEVFHDVKQAVKTELDCQICLGLMVDPCTTPCGHSFCQLCLVRILNHSDLCPICRRKLPGSLPSSTENSRLSGLISAFFPLQLEERREALKEDVSGDFNETKVPLFVCTLSFPSMRTFLYVFEPRYRLMITRVMQSTHRRFGMVAPNRAVSHHESDSSNSRLMEYGTILEIDRLTPLGDGRCIIRATGQYRFKVLESTVVDGYDVGEIERVDDISLAEEETREASETGLSAPTEDDEKDEFDRQSTHRLFQIALTYIAKCRANKASWLDRQVYKLYGPPPPDSRIFSYWFASVLPRPEEDRYAVLPITSVRERLKIVTRWIKKLETGEWSSDMMTPEVPRHSSPVSHFSSHIRPVSSSLVATLETVLGTLIIPALLFLAYKLAAKWAASIPNSFSISFSTLPFSFSLTFSYHSSPLSPTEARQQHQTRAREQLDTQRRNFNPDLVFVNPNLMDRENIPTTIILGAVFALCIVKVIRQIVALVKLERGRAERQRRREGEWEAELNNDNAGRVSDVARRQQDGAHRPEVRDVEGDAPARQGSPSAANPAGAHDRLPHDNARTVTISAEERS
ncbi:hypothetical protein PRK78_004568 [Emydomyces testavorans]|uniref:Uncharacterized protein n=1 Tax=Emydomyces testavorans TaxID=2070801 RepID=A0AAF0ILS3_9EURO|nr:hypothetical protein PRK78_004568 [Emydomyces testavorans]